MQYQLLGGRNNIGSISKLLNLVHIELLKYSLLEKSSLLYGISTTYSAAYFLLTDIVLYEYELIPNVYKRSVFVGSMNL